MPQLELQTTTDESGPEAMSAVQDLRLRGNQRTRLNGDLRSEAFHRFSAHPLPPTTLASFSIAAAGRCG